MVLAAAVLIGFAAGFLRAALAQRPYRTPNLRYPALVLVAFLPQFVAFYLSRSDLPNLGGLGEWAPVILVSTQLLLLVFAWFNRRQPGFWLLGLGLALNLLVILLNGGYMPISPETVRKNYPYAPDSAWRVGQRLGNGKDIVLPVEETRLWFLSDRFTFQSGGNLFVAFSLGDILIALGAFWLLWSLGGPSKSVHAGQDRCAGASEL